MRRSLAHACSFFSTTKFSAILLLSYCTPTNPTNQTNRVKIAQTAITRQKTRRVLISSRDRGGGGHCPRPYTIHASELNVINSIKIDFFMMIGGPHNFVCPAGPHRSKPGPALFINFSRTNLNSSRFTNLACQGLRSRGSEFVLTLKAKIKAISLILYAPTNAFKP